MEGAQLPETLVFIATSLDGYIARLDDGLDWLPVGGDEAGNDFGYAALMATIDTIVLGRRTFEKVLTFGGWPYDAKRVIVVSSGTPEMPDEIRDRVEVISSPPADLLAHLGATGSRRIYVDGGVTIQRFLAAGLIGEMTITRVPVLIGSGIPLFGALPGDVVVTHETTTAYSNGMVQSRYRIAGQPKHPAFGT